MLISMGASLHIPNHNGKTAIDCVLEYRYGNDDIRIVLCNYTSECILAILMGMHIRLGATSLVRQLDEVVLDLILLEMQQLLASITHNAFNDV